MHGAVYGTGAASFVEYEYPRIMRTNPDLSYIVSGGAVSQDYSNAGTLQLYDSDDANWLVHSILAEAEL